MEFLSPYFLTLIITGPVFLFLGFLMKRNPPRKINWLYGYRTKASHSSQAKWDFAQVYSSERMMESGILLTLLACVGLFVDSAGSEALHVTIAVLLVLAGAFYPVWRTERELKRKFDAL